MKNEYVEEKQKADCSGNYRSYTGTCDGGSDGFGSNVISIDIQMKKKIMAALLAGVMLLQQPVSGWCAQNTELTQKSEARQESESSEDTADGSEEDTEATGTAAADDGENSQEEDSEDVPTLQAETDEVTLGYRYLGQCA